MYPNGDIYFGDWQANLFHGEGVKYNTNGTIEHGKFEDDKFIGK